MMRVVVLQVLAITSCGMLTARLSQAEDAAGAIRASVAAARAAFEAGHWPESTAKAREILSSLDKDTSSFHAARADLLRLLAEGHQADAADALKAYDAAIAAGQSTAEILEGRGHALRLLDRDAEAVKCFDQSLAMRPDHAGTLETRGLARMDLHDNAAALADISRAAKLAPAEARYRITLASMHRRLGDIPAAKAALEEAVRLAKAAGDDCRRGEAFTDLRRYREAVEAETAAIGRDPKNLRALSLRSAAHAAKHDARAALDDAREIARLDPRDAGHWLRIGKIEWDGLHDENAAMKSFDQGLTIAPRDVALLIARGRLKAGSNDHEGANADFKAADAANPNALDVLSARAAMHSRRREFKESLANYDRLHGIVPRNPDTLRERAIVRRTMGNEKESLADCDAALALLPPGDHVGRGHIQRDAKRWPESIEAYTRAIAADPTNPRLLHDRAWIHNETKEFERAAADCRAGLAIDPDDLNLQEEMAYALKGTGNHDEAIAFITKLIDRNPRGDPGLYVYRGEALMAKKEPAAARADLQRACELEPNNPQHWLGLGKACEAAKDIDAAAEALRRAAAIPPRDPQRALEPGLLYWRKSNYQNAVSEFERVTKEDPKNADAWFWLGVSHRNADSYDKALAAFDKAISLEPGRAKFHGDRGFVLMLQKRHADAIRAYDRAIELDPGRSDYFHYRAACRGELKEWDGSLDDFTEAARLDEKSSHRRSILTDRLLKRVRMLAKENDRASIVALADKIFYVSQLAAKDDRESVDQLLVSLADAYKSRGESAKVEKVHKHALQVMELAFGPDHAETAKSLRKLAECYAADGQYAVAEPLVKRALSIREKALGAEHSDTIETLNLLAIIYKKRGEFELAETLFRRELATLERQHGVDHWGTARPLGDLGLLCYEQGRYVEAEGLLKRSLEVRLREWPDFPATGQAFNNIGLVYQSRGRYAEAGAAYKRALAIAEKFFDPDDPEYEFVAAALGNVAGIDAAQGQYSKARSLYSRAVEINEKVLGKEHPEIVAHLMNLALTYVDEGKPALAEPFLRRALAICEKSLGPEHPNTASVLNNLAECCLSQGKRADGKSMHERALAIREKKFGSDHMVTAMSLNNVAGIHLALREYPLAEPLYRRAMDVFEKTVGPDHPHTAMSMYNIAFLEMMRGRFQPAADVCDRARRSTRRHVSRVLPSLSALEQAVFLRTQDERVLHSALSLGLIQKASPRIASLSAGWLANAKAVAQEAAAQQIILARASTDPATVATVALLDRVRANVARLSQQPPGPGDAGAWRASIEKLQAEELRLVHEIGGQLAALDRDDPWVEVDDIRKNLPATGILVDIARFGLFDFSMLGQGKSVQPARYAAWIIPPAGKGDVTIVDLGPAEEIDADVAAYRAAIEAVQKGGFKRGQSIAEQELTITAAPLATKVLQPIIEAVGSATEIILSPDGSLWLVPWQALPLADGSYAIEKFAIRTVTSARDLVPVPVEAKGGRGGPVVVADPAFDMTPASPMEKSAAETSRSFAPSTDIVRKFGRLPNTRFEAVASKPVLAKLTGSEPKVFLGPDATELNLKQAAVRPKAVVLATHGFFKPDQKVKLDDKSLASLSRAGDTAGPGSLGGTRAVTTTTGEALEDPLLRCGLALAGANIGAKAGGGDDGILTGAEIVGLDLLGTDLVVLSACETGVGTVKNGEGVAGLRQAFQIAGAKSVVATLWQVPDAESAQIMAAFYANLAKGQPSSKALREAQLAFIKARREDRNYESAHPYLWAAYGVTGR